MPRKRQTGEGGLYFDAKRQLWIGVVDNGLTPEGKRKQVRVTSKSQTIARDKLRNLIRELETHDTPLGSQTVAEWGSFWLEGIKSKKPQTYRTYQSMLKTWILPAIGRKNIKDVRPSDLRRIYDTMKAAGKSGSTALKAHNVMSSMFESARLERLTPINVAQDIRPPKAAKSTRDTLAPDETKRILEAARELPNGSKWWVSLFAGIRQGERLGATLDSVDFSRGTFTVQWNLVAANYEHGCGGTCGKRFAGDCPQAVLVIPDVLELRRLNGRNLLVPPKSGESRTFYLPDGVLELLHRDVTALTANTYGLMWPGPDGNPVNPRHDQEQWRALLKSAGVNRLDATTHWARHTAISDLSAAGVADRTIGETVGHKSPGVTGRYQHVSSADAAAAMRKLEERRQLES